MHRPKIGTGNWCHVERQTRAKARPFSVKVLFSKGGRKEAVEATASFRTVTRPPVIPFITRARIDLPEVLLEVLPMTAETDSRSTIDL